MATNKKNKSHNITFNDDGEQLCTKCAKINPEKDYKTCSTCRGYVKRSNKIATIKSNQNISRQTKRNQIIAANNEFQKQKNKAGEIILIDKLDPMQMLIEKLNVFLQNKEYDKFNKLSNLIYNNNNRTIEKINLKYNEEDKTFHEQIITQLENYYKDRNMNTVIKPIKKIIKKYEEVEISRGKIKNILGKWNHITQIKRKVHPIIAQFIVSFFSPEEQLNEILYFQKNMWTKRHDLHFLRSLVKLFPYIEIEMLDAYFSTKNIGNTSFELPFEYPFQESGFVETNDFKFDPPKYFYYSERKCAFFEISRPSKYISDLQNIIQGPAIQAEQSRFLDFKNILNLPLSISYMCKLRNSQISHSQLIDDDQSIIKLQHFFECVFSDERLFPNLSSIYKQCIKPFLEWDQIQDRPQPPPQSTQICFDNFDDANNYSDNEENI